MPKGKRRPGYNPLKATRPAALRRQARKELASAYKPVYKGLAREKSRLAALDVKREADEASFHDWMTTQQNNIRTQTQTRIDAVRAQAATSHTELVSALQAARGPGAAAQFGGGSDAGPAQGVDALVAGAEQSSITQSAGANVGLDDAARMSDDLIGATQVNNLAYAGSLTAKRKAQHLDALSKVSEGVQKAKLSQAGDVQRRIAQLFDNEIRKAQIRAAGVQFNRRMTNQNEQNEKSRAVTRQGQKDSNAKYWGAYNRWGYKRSDWEGKSQAQKDKIIADQKALPGADGGSGAKKGNPTPSQVARFNDAVSGGTAFVHANKNTRDQLKHMHNARPGAIHANPKARQRYADNLIKQLMGLKPIDQDDDGKPIYRTGTDKLTRSQALLVVWRLDHGSKARPPKNLRAVSRQGALALPSSG